MSLKSSLTLPQSLSSSTEATLSSTEVEEDVKVKIEIQSYASGGQRTAPPKRDFVSRRDFGSY